MNMVWNSLARMLLLMMLAAALTNCAAPSRPSPPLVVGGPELTPLPAEISAIDLPKPGVYWGELTALRKDLQAELKSTSPKPGS